MEWADEGLAVGVDERRRHAALRRLPVAYALALQLREAGVDDATLAERLAIEPEAVGPLLAVADAKLATLLGADPPPAPAP
jgi:hypothetical protein